MGDVIRRNREHMFDDYVVVCFRINPWFGDWSWSLVVSSHHLPSVCSRTVCMQQHSGVLWLLYPQ